MKDHVMKEELKNIVRLKKTDEWHRLNTEKNIVVDKIQLVKGGLA